MSGTRERILARVRAALADVPRDETPEDVPAPRDYARAHTSPASPEDGVPMPQNYAHARTSTELVTLLEDRLEDYKARTHRVAAANLPEAVAAALTRRAVGRLAAPADLPLEWTSRTDAVVLPDFPDKALSLADLDSAHGVLTGCAVAIAETGTIVLDAGPTQGRRALTLVPDYHLCVVHAAQIVPDVSDAVAQLAPARPLTWISGPSATSDIELNRIEGVHGPRTLEVLIAV